MDLKPPATILQFAATLVSDDPNDQQREFVISYYVEDRAFSISERLIPNSGFRSGKFMQKTVVNNPSTNQPYAPSEIYIGANVEISGRKFCLQEASENALKIMEARSDVFTKCDLHAILERMRTQLRGKVPEFLVQFQKIDPKKRYRVSLLELEDILNQFEVALNDQELLTIFRRFQFSNTDKFCYQDFVKLLA